MIFRSFLAVLTLSAGCLQPVFALTADIDYDIRLAGLPLGTATTRTILQKNGTVLSYRVTVQAELTGLAGLITGGKGSGEASGIIRDGRLRPETFSVRSRDKEAERTVRMSLKPDTVHSSVQALDIAPALDEKPDRVVVTDLHKKNVLDPMAALLMPVVDKSSPSAACERVLPIYDGGARFDVSLHMKGSLESDVEGYTEPVVVCSARYTPIAGHRPNRRAIKFMSNNKDMSVWLGRLSSDGSDVYTPLRISVKTQLGTVVLSARRFVVN
jgi:Protein of unknown function (DUF3108)